MRSKSFTAIQEMAQLIKRYGLEEELLIKLNNSKSFKLYKFAQGILENRYINDFEVIGDIYDEDSITAKYKMLKGRLVEAMVDVMPLVNPSLNIFSDLQKINYSNSKKYIANVFIHEQGYHDASVYLFERQLKKIKNQGPTELKYLIIRQLILFYGSLARDRESYYKYIKQLNQAEYELKAEIEIEKLYSYFQIAVLDSKESHRDQLVSRLENMLDDIKNKYSNVTTGRYLRVKYLVEINICHLSRKYQNGIKLCNDAIKLFSEKRYRSWNVISNFTTRLLVYHLILGEFENGENIAESNIWKLRNGSYNWYVNLYYYFLLCTHSKQYQKAYSLLQKAMTHPKFKSFYAPHKQMWYVNHAFCQFLISRGKIREERSSESRKTKFRLYKFLNEIPIFSKDKRGLNVTILVIHVLFLLEQKKYDQIIDRVDALNQYCHRYLKKDDTFRSNCFIKMLMKMATRGHFNRIATERHTQVLRAKLASVPINIADQGIEVEIIPYEDLWDIVLEMLP